ncbi:2TM domain-containing protein [Ornithinibacillus scapharcae]|uniref:2TM domain-containing protein n=1 Tax=Ornithinibacillus scapharcae TaxID=1147159 RepID=UPI000225B649|nr:2TM domain-containing protein [Ornithinibacillus scapharcae]
MIGWLIIACEIGFWVFVLVGLTSRYILKKKKLGTILLICTPLVDLVLLIATVYDLKNGAVATTIHGIAAIYIGVSVAFGHQMIRWADERFNYRFGNGNQPAKVKKFGKEHARKEREGWYRHLLSWFIGVALLMGIILYINDHSQTERLLRTVQLWSIVLVIDFIISFSYTLFPRNEKV